VIHLTNRQNKGKGFSVAYVCSPARDISCLYRLRSCLSSYRDLQAGSVFGARF
jgi:hypothetical protein